MGARLAAAVAIGLWIGLAALWLFVLSPLLSDFTSSSSLPVVGWSALISLGCLALYYRLKLGGEKSR